MLTPTYFQHQIFHVFLPELLLIIHTNLHHFIFIFKQSTPIVTSRFPAALYLAVLKLVTIAAGISLFHRLLSCRFIVTGTILFVSLFAYQYFFLSPSFRLYLYILDKSLYTQPHPHLCSTTMFQNFWVPSWWNHRTLQLYLTTFFANHLNLHYHNIFRNIL